jgi:uncharacterized membrane protein YfcA
MPDVLFVILLCGAAFFGALVSGLAGFAFSAVAGAILLHIMPPIEAVPLMMICSLPVQCATIVTARHAIRWQSNLVLIAGGLVGILPAVWLLQQIEIWPFRLAFGLFVASYAAYMLIRPAATPRPCSLVQELLIGFGGGVIGGLTAMPGALPTIWCDLRGVPQREQRALVQPFIVVMQIFALAVIITRYGIPSRVLLDVTMSLPALVAGTTLGLLLYSRLKEFTFRRIVLGTLFFSGLTLVF